MVLAGSLQTADGGQQSGEDDQVEAGQHGRALLRF